ncbi:MAG: hypothetical protein ACI86X_000876 [Moritella sp.]|jgi:hypothetical protein
MIKNTVAGLLSLLVAEQVFNPVLKSMLVYRLKNDLTPSMVKTVLESIKVQNKQLVATLKVI